MYFFLLTAPGLFSRGEVPLHTCGLSIQFVSPPIIQTINPRPCLVDIDPEKKTTVENTFISTSHFFLLKHARYSTNKEISSLTPLAGFFFSSKFYWRITMMISRCFIRLLFVFFGANLITLRKIKWFNFVRTTLNVCTLPWTNLERPISPASRLIRRNRSPLSRHSMYDGRPKGSRSSSVVVGTHGDKQLIGLCEGCAMTYWCLGWTLIVWVAGDWWVCVNGAGMESARCRNAKRLTYLIVPVQYEMWWLPTQ